MYEAAVIPWLVFFYQNQNFNGFTKRKVGYHGNMANCKCPHYFVKLKKKIYGPLMDGFQLPQG